jgi:undecaprenyl-phosphate galactose phosphotransferase/putative colanic acid biosynthesis UDP-glucose lipid carrier transferase
MYIALHIDEVKTIHELTALCERYMVRIKLFDFQLYRSRKVQITFYGNTPLLMLRKNQ